MARLRPAGMLQVDIVQDLLAFIAEVQVAKFDLTMMFTILRAGQHPGSRAARA